MNMMSAIRPAEHATANCSNNAIAVTACLSVGGSWAQTMGDYLAAKAAEEKYDCEVWTPAYERMAAFEERMGIANADPDAAGNGIFFASSIRANLSQRK